MKNNQTDNLLQKNKKQYTGWAISILLLLIISYQYIKTEKTKNKLQENIVALEIRNQQNQSVLAILRDEKNSIIKLEGQLINPKASAKVYWNKEKQTVYIDATGLPQPPQGKVYQVWSLKLNPLTPTSIGLLENFSTNEQRMFPVSATQDTEAFGITLEPESGSKSPSLDQLYTLGKA